MMNKANNAVGAYLTAFFTFFILFVSQFAYAAPTFPQLTGRVVDEANILQPATKQALEAQLAEIEKVSSDQLVVVTLKSLQGYEIEEYGYQLGRAWGIGQAKLNNGILLIVAPNERKVRIEVGYGLEGTMTDALSHQVISQAIIPQFRAGNMEQGIVDGVAGIDGILKLSPEERADRAAKAAAQGVGQNSGNSEGGIPIVVVIFIIIWIIILIQSSRRSRFRRHSGYDNGINILPIIFHDWDNDDRGGGGGFGGGGFGGGGFGGGFGGGGGGFGGGGSSGSW